jgi:YesN/AraC family two-component response regulator
LPPDEGLAVLSRLPVVDRLAKVIVVSGQGDKQSALRAVGAGSYDFLCKPVDVDELKLVLQRCVYVAELEREYRAMTQRKGLVETASGGTLVLDEIGDLPAALRRQVGPPKTARHSLAAVEAASHAHPRTESAGAGPGPRADLPPQWAGPVVDPDAERHVRWCGR